MPTVMLIGAAIVALAVVGVLVARRARRLPGEFSPPEAWPYCLDDFGPLGPGRGGQVQCETCGRSYRAALIDQVDPDDWAELARDRMFCRDCEEPEPGVPRVYTDEYGPVPCPTHGPASAAPSLAVPDRRPSGTHVA